MYKINQIILSFILCFLFVIFTFNLKNFRIDASSDTLVAQNDKDFLFYLSVPFMGIGCFMSIYGTIFYNK